MKRKASFWLGIVGCLSLLPSAPSSAKTLPVWMSSGKKGMVASDSSYASFAGQQILQAGGNAVDAAVAVSFALGVTRPYSTGLGGGGFMIARLADGRVIVQDFRETAPAAATPEMFVKARAENPDGPDPSRYGGLAVGVPGLVAGRCQALQRYGTMPLSKALEPAVKLAESGFSVTNDYVRAAMEAVQVFEKHPSLERDGYLYMKLLYEGVDMLPVVRSTQPNLVKLFRGLSDNGPDFFYRGPVAEAIVKTVKRHGGVLTEKDLADYKVIEREPLRTKYRDYEIIGMPPPSAGGVALAQMLNIFEALDFASVAKKEPDLALHYQVEALKHAFADRSRWLADGDRAKVPVSRLTSKNYARRLAAKFNKDRALDLEAYGSQILPDDSGTSHFCVVDRWGNVVVSTETINTTFGSLLAVEEFGLVLNNQMDDFVTAPGRPNAFELVQGGGNTVAPGKRPVSSMSPTIVMKNGEPYLLIGASGGPRIISGVLNVLLGVTDRGLTLEKVILQPRPHHQWKPDVVFFDRPPSSEMRTALTDRGHRVSDKYRTSVIQAILRGDGEWIGASDPRAAGRPLGY